MKQVIKVNTRKLSLQAAAQPSNVPELRFMTFSDIGANVNRAIVLVPFNLLLAESNLEPFYGRSQSAKFPLGRVFHLIRSNSGRERHQWQWL